MQSIQVRLRDIPPTERPREKMANKGAKSLADEELLAIFFRTGSRGVNAIELGNRLLQKYGSLHALARCSIADLSQENGVGLAKATQLAAALELADRLAREQIRAQSLDCPELVYALLGPEMSRLRKESLRILLLNSRYHILKNEEISLGSVNESIAHPREILRPAIMHAAYGFVLVHNHPSGDPLPSKADKELTKRVKEAATIFQIKMVDHIIIGLPLEEREPYFSFREAGLLS